MPEILPSEALRLVIEIFPWVGSALNGDRNAAQMSLSAEHAPKLSTVAALARNVPEDYLPYDARDRSTYFAALELMQGSVNQWVTASHPARTTALDAAAAFGRESPVVAVCRILARASDERRVSAAVGLEFIHDSGAQADLLVDRANAHRALAGNEFKASTVLAGSVIEALLLWRVSEIDPTERGRLLAEWRAAKTADPSIVPVPKGGPAQWQFADLLAMLARAELLDESTRIAIGLAKDYRNLIHPGRALRHGDRCSQATALSALGAMERLVDRLTTEANG